MPCGLGSEQQAAGILGIVLLKEPATALRLFFLGLLLVAIVGLKLTTPEPIVAPIVDENAPAAG